MFVLRFHDKTIWSQVAKTIDASLSGIIVGQIEQINRNVLTQYRGKTNEADIKLLVDSYMASFNTTSDLDRADAG